MMAASRETEGEVLFCGIPLAGLGDSPGGVTG